MRAPLWCVPIFFSWWRTTWGSAPRASTRPSGPHASSCWFPVALNTHAHAHTRLDHLVPIWIPCFLPALIAGPNVTTTTLLATAPCAILTTTVSLHPLIAVESLMWLTMNIQDSSASQPKTPGHYRDHTDRANRLGRLCDGCEYNSACSSAKICRP